MFRVPEHNPNQVEQKADAEKSSLLSVTHENDSYDFSVLDDLIPLLPAKTKPSKSE